MEPRSVKYMYYNNYITVTVKILEEHYCLEEGKWRPLVIVRGIVDHEFNRGQLIMSC